jgi:integrase
MKLAQSRHPRNREYLTPKEIDKLLATAKHCGRWPERDYCMILMMFHHGLRVSELVKMKISDIDLEEENFHVNRAKGGSSGGHPIYKEDRRALLKWLKIRSDMGPATDAMFISERRTKIHRSQVWLMVRKVGERAGLGHLNIHPHSLRHSCGYDLINRDVPVRTVQSFLGHKSLQTTVRYTQLAPGRFVKFFE